MSTERQNVGETEIKMTIKMKIILQEIPTSMGNETTVEKDVTRLLIVGQRKEKRNTITLKTSLWDPHSVENFKKIKTKKITNNG